MRAGVACCSLRRRGLAELRDLLLLLLLLLTLCQGRRSRKNQRHWRLQKLDLADDDEERVTKAQSNAREVTSWRLLLLVPRSRLRGFSARWSPSWTIWRRTLNTAPRVRRPSLLLHSPAHLTLPPSQPVQGAQRRRDLRES